MVCLFMVCGAVLGDEDFDRMLALYRQSGVANMEQRLREYEALQQMRRANGQRHLPAGSQFDFARESYRMVRSDGPGKTDANGCAWTSAGPTNLNGRVTSIAIDPTDNKRIYAATVGGLWRSETAGRRWQRVSDDFLATVFGAIAVNPGTPNEILAGGGDSDMAWWYTGDGMYRSTDYGSPGSWSKVTNAFDNKVVYQIQIDPAPPYDVYVAASNGVWLGVHNAGGITFTRIGNFDAVTHDIAVDFSSTPRKIYAGVRAASSLFSVGIYKWDGTSWQEKDSGIDLSDAETISLALAKSNPSILYAKVSQLSDGTLIGIYKTTVAGEGFNAWALLPNAVPDEIMGWYNSMLEVDPTDPDRVFAGEINLWMSTNGGATWENVSKGKDLSYPLEVHSDVHTLAFDPVNPKIVYVGNDGGIDRSLDLSSPGWHWNDVSHGMIITMFYYLTSNRAVPSLLAGGMQDNGTGITFGNRTWYQPGGCDGYDVGSDAENPDTLYANCNGGVYELANPVPGTSGGSNTIPWTFTDQPRPPLITDIVTPRAALAAGGTLCAIQTIVKTIDGVDWTATKTSFPPGGAAVALASAPSGAFKTYLAAVAYRPPDSEDCPGFAGTTFNPFVIRTDDGGTTWTPVTGLPATLEPSSVAFDPADKLRSYVTYRNGGGRIYMSTGGPYSKIAGSGLNTLPADVRRVVADPFDPNVLYAGTSVGVFRGVVTLSTPPTASWAPFNEGLPDGLEINDLWVDPGTGVLTIGSFGFGAFRRDIRAEAKCAARMLVVRDTVYDDGRDPSPSGGPDAEHPILDPTRPGPWFYKPDDTLAGRTWWWTSRDIRIDVPAKDPQANEIADADSVEFELCSTAVAMCPPGSMLDSAPDANDAARVYVQVTNRGVEPVASTRVIALWNPSGGAFDSLPDTFWTKTFPANDKCGPLDPGTGWQLIDPIEPCRTIAPVTPDVPELARFDWKVPFGADGGATMLTIVESPEDPLDPSIRQQNKLAPSEIVPASRHIALRNLRIKPYDLRVHVPLLWPLDLLHLPHEMSEVEVVVSKPDLRDSVRIALPAGLTAHGGSGSARQTRVTEEELVRQPESMHIDPDNAWELSGDEASLFVDLKPGQRVTTAVIATPAGDGTTSQVSIVERSEGKVVGGSVMLLRPNAH
jgi:hypothetical protein